MKEAFEKNGVSWQVPLPSEAVVGVPGHIGAIGLIPEMEVGECYNVWYATLPSREKYVFHLCQHANKRCGDERRVFTTTRSAARSCHEKPRVEEFPCVLPHHSRSARTFHLT
jgi:hypothetical protein